MKLEIYGSSDDLIEIDGDLQDEFYACDDGRNYLAFSDGTILRIVFDNDGFWRITSIVNGTATYELIQGTDSDSDYSDKASLTGDIAWVAHARSYVTKEAV